jgi:hypothetical protein
MIDAGGAHEVRSRESESELFAREKTLARG